MVSTPEGHAHSRFRRLADHLRPGDLLVANTSATLPASLPAGGEWGPFLLNLSTEYGRYLWLAEPRWSPGAPGPLPVRPGDRIEAGGLQACFVSPYPGLTRLWFIRFEGDAKRAMAEWGQPIRYGYVEKPYPLSAYQTVFSRDPGSAEMPSAARPFTPRVLDSLRERGIGIAEVTLHTGVSSLEVEEEDVEAHPLYPEPFAVPASTADAVNVAKRDGRRVIAVGTTVVRALESAWDGARIRPARGFTRRYVHPGAGVRTVDGLLTGLHDPVTSHLAMLYALTGRDRIRSAYAEAVREGYLWHEFGDSHLIWRE
jgi:S-adenosylmethionine:tRNA ribosyltransferase-isomerase